MQYCLKFHLGLADESEKLTRHRWCYGGKGGSQPSPPSETTTTQEPWSGLQPHLRTLYSEAERLRAQGGPGYFPGDTLAPVSPLTTQAIDAQAGRALAGSPVQQAGQSQALQTLQGDYLSPQSNPYLADTFNTGARQIENRLRGAWGSDDTMTGSSGLQQAALGTSLADLATRVYGENYNRERGRQAALIPLAPSLAAADYADIGQLASAGQTERALGQQSINDDIQRYNYEQNLPYLNLQNFGSLLSGIQPGGTTTATSTQPVYGGSGGNGLLGAALGGGAGYLASPLLGAAAVPATATAAAVPAWGLGAAAGPAGILGGALLGGLLGK